MDITFLGTSSGTPTIQRNVTSVAVHMDSCFCLFDCGEGTQHQLKNAKISLSKIASVMISHLHGDHIFGLPGLLGSMSLLQRHKPLHVLGPTGIQAFIHNALKASHTYLDYPLHIEELSQYDQVTSIRAVNAYQVSCISLKHRIPALGYRIQAATRPGRFHVDIAKKLGIPNDQSRGQLCRGESITLANGQKIKPEDVIDPPRPGKILSICTDTEYCPQSVKLSAKADLLVHEATYAEKDRVLAMRGGHSTSHDAAQVAKAADVKKLVLTHFSPRYVQIDDVLQGVEAIFPNVILARDFMCLQI